jgi:putative ABC transport system ATP-binding protein
LLLDDPSVTRHPGHTEANDADGAVAARAEAATKTYGKGESVVRALDGIDVSFEAHRFTAIMGPSGSGKSTLMHALAGLDELTDGHVTSATST